MPKIGNIILPDYPLLLAPMEDVSDPPFRRLCKMHGADLMYSEFISSEGLIRNAMKSRMKLDWSMSLLKLKLIQRLVVLLPRSSLFILILC